MDIFEKLKILTDSAKYDVACTSSGVDRAGQKGALGSAAMAGICHSFSSDGRCISLLKVLLSNVCVYDCKYCVNRVTNDVPRATFTARELADLTIDFYRRNYIEGLFLSSAVVKNPDYTCECMLNVLQILRNEYKFRGYIHVKAIPGASRELTASMGMLADRMSVNIELPSEQSLKILAPNKTKTGILAPMNQIKQGIEQSSHDIVKYRHSPKFVPAGQSTQMIIGATGDTDYKILNLTEGLYKKYSLKRVFFSAYIAVAQNSLLPAVDTPPPLLREHRLYQADWLLRFYKFSARELLSEENQSFNEYLDPKCNWAINNYHLFPVEVNTCEYEMLLRVPGIGVTSAVRIMKARRVAYLGWDGLKKIGVVIKRAQYFLLCNSRTLAGVSVTPESALNALMPSRFTPLLPERTPTQLSLFDKGESSENFDIKTN